jgi:predicted nucleic acid-binding Zn ribbon protein
MTRCKYCHTDHILDAKGRCPSCADAGDATAYGLHYGDYIAAKPRPYVLPVAVTPLRELPVMNPEKVCRICGKPIPPESGRRTLCSLECQAEFNRQSAKAAHYKAKAAKAAKEKPLRRCAICGKPLPINMRKYCSPECAHVGVLKTQRESKARQKKGNAK